MADTPSRTALPQSNVCPHCSIEYDNGVVVCPRDGETLVSKTGDANARIFVERYEILELLGKGGMSAVYRARHLLMKKDVAIKMMHKHTASDAVSVRRFQQEAEATSKLSHRNIVGVHDFGVTSDGEPFLVMDYLEGTSLLSELKEKRSLSVSRCVNIFCQVLAGLIEAHGKGIIHRDLKPSNIMLLQSDEKSDDVRIVDFGIAKLLEEDAQHLTQTGEAIGTPFYMSPEQCNGLQGQDPATDIYAIACVMYECLSGQPPFRGTSALDTFNKHIKELPKPLTSTQNGQRVPPLLEASILKGLEKDPKRRHLTAAAFQRSIIEALDKSKEQEALQYLVGRAQTRMNRLRQRVGENLLKLAAATIAITIGAALLIAYKPEIRDALHKALSPTLYSIYRNIGEVLAPIDFADAKYFLEAAVAEADYQRIADIRINSRDSLQNLYQHFGQRSKWKELDAEIKTIKSQWLLSRLQVSMGSEDKLSARLVKEAPVPIDPQEAQAMAKLLTDLADRCLRRGAYELAQAQAEKAIEIFTNLHGSDTSFLLVPLNVQAAAQERTGDLVSANKTALRALDLAAKTSDSHLDAQAKSNLNLAHLAQSQGDWQKAGSYFRNAIDLAEKGDLHLDNAASLKECLSEYAAYLRREQRIPESEQIDQNLKAVEAKWPDKAPVSDRTAR